MRLRHEYGRGYRTNKGMKMNLEHDIEGNEEDSFGSMEKQRKDKQMSYKEDAGKGEDLSRASNVDARADAWNEAIADAERKVEGYKRRIATLRTTLRILRALKKKDSAGKN